MFKTTDTGALKQDKKCQPCWYIILSTMSGSTTVSISIGITSRVSNQSHTSLFERGNAQLNCDAYLLAGHRACIRVFIQNINAVDVTTTINGNNYLFKFHGGTRTEFENTLPTFMQMLTTFTPK